MDLDAKHNRAIRDEVADRLRTMLSREPSGIPPRLLQLAARARQEVVMTTVAALLARKQELIQRLQQECEPEKRDEVERLLEKINTALNLLDQPRRETQDKP
ncbi:hypothetical protein [Bradyrhizobium sp. STM 3562]|uniref:hypothetical protein n=1 Tax=Bradyrhizobium sp. STM 3562 TaxID=578924 RepID=UPI00388E8004